MRVKLLLFGGLREALGSEQELELAAESTVGDALALLRKGPSADLLARCAVAVNREYATRGTELKAGDEVALLPPVSGGNNSVCHVVLTREEIIPANLRATLATAEDGAVCTFEGVVRNNSRGRATLFLDYEAYEAMALQQMRELARQAQAEFGVHGVVVVHRLGRLQVGECSVFIGVASPHRAEAFAACRWLIDTLKATVPIWKKEHFADGAEWAAGEPFPEARVAR